MAGRRSISSFAPETALIAGTALLCAAGLTRKSGPTGLEDTVLLVQVGILCLAYAGATWQGGSAKQGLGLTAPDRPLSLLGGSAAVLGLIGLSFGLNLLLAASGMRETSVLAEFEEHLSTRRGLEIIYALAGMAVLPAVAEELLFRGFLLGRLRAHWGNSVALVGSSLMFGVAHLDLAQGSAAVILGFYLGYIRLRTGSVHAAILCHMSNNSVAILAPLVLASG